MKELQAVLTAIQAVCTEWNAIKEAHTEHGYMFSYKLYELSGKVEDWDSFNVIAEDIFENWKEEVRIAAGYSPEKWDYNKYFEHDKHHGSYFRFKEDIDSGLDFWAEPIGLEWDSTEGNAWEFTPFEKAINAVYGVTRFSTDRLKPEDYTPEEIAEITADLTENVLPAITETLAERKAVIKAYDEIKAHQCDYAEVYADE
jgi:hypothetical protein